MSIGSICNRNTVIVRRQASVTETARLMRQNHVGSVVVIDDSDGRTIPVGLVTDRDLVLEVLAAEVDPASVCIGDLPGYALVTARETDGLWEVMQRMRSHGIRRMPVVSDAGELVGIVTVDDLLELLAVEFNELTRVIGREQARELKTRPPIG